MARYHVNPKGEAGVCRARVSCPYGSLETDHFDTAEEARAAYEAGKLDETFTTLSKAVDSTLDSAITDDQLLAGIAKAGWPTFDPAKGDEQFKSEDDRLLEGIAKAGWPVFDPAKGPEQFAAVEDDFPGYQLTDEDMAELDAHYAARPEITVEENFERDGRLAVMANGQQAFVTDSRDVADAAGRVASAGQWTALEDVADSGRYANVKLYLSKPLDYLADAKLDLEEKLALPRDPAPKAVAQRNFDASQLQLVNVAIAVKMHEAEAERAAKLLPNDEPPF